MTYSFKKATGHAGKGGLLALIPAVLTWLISRHYITDGDAAMATAFMTWLVSSYGTEFSAFKAKLKAWQEDQK